MKPEKSVSVCIVGLGFGAEFIPIYQALPGVDKVAICARTASKVKEAGNHYNIPEDLRFTDYNEVLKRKDINTIHVVSPFAIHAEQTLAALRAGKHCACTVPMAMTGIHDDGNSHLYSGIPLCEESGGDREAG